MDQWEGALMSAHAGKIKASVGLSDSVYDRNRWSQFLVGAPLHTQPFMIRVAVYRC